jgi:hypothetical protein
MSNKRWCHACSLWFMWGKSEMSVNGGGGNVTWHAVAGVPSFAGDVSVTRRLRRDFTIMMTTMYYVLLRYYFVHGRWISNHHRGASSASRHTMKNCRFLESPGEMWCGNEATVIIGPFIERIKVRMTETDCVNAPHYDIHSQTCRCNFTFTDEHPVYIGVKT